MNDLDVHADTIKLLWTGGWDSTFRLCDLVLIRKVKVQPIYLIDSERMSFSIEIKSMNKIKKIIFKKDKFAVDRILPTFFLSIEDIKGDSLINNQFLNLKKHFKIGGQYDWMARFVAQFNILDLEICVERYTVHSDSGLYLLLKESKNMIKAKSSVGEYFKLVDNPDNPDLNIFKGFRFSLLTLSKLDMRETAEKEGFLDVMDETWFCHRPSKGLKPCGTCNPCFITIEEGLRYRFPKISLLKYLGKSLEKSLLSSQNIIIVRMINLLRGLRNSFKGGN